MRSRSQDVVKKFSRTRQMNKAVLAFGAPVATFSPTGDDGLEPSLRDSFSEARSDLVHHVFAKARMQHESSVPFDDLAKAVNSDPAFLKLIAGTGNEPIDADSLVQAVKDEDGNVNLASLQRMCSRGIEDVRGLLHTIAKFDALLPMRVPVALKRDKTMLADSMHRASQASQRVGTGAGRPWPSAVSGPDSGDEEDAASPACSECRAHTAGPRVAVRWSNTASPGRERAEQDDDGAPKSTTPRRLRKRLTRPWLRRMKTTFW